MTPTDAQIQAAARAIRAVLQGKRIAKGSDALAKAALTAAAEVAKVENAPVFNMTDTWNSGDIPYNATKMKVTDQYSAPAAEVGQQENEEMAAIAEEYKLNPIVGFAMDKIEAHTIERCAQRAHDWLKDHGYEVEAIECAAAIRALKDKND